MSARPIFSAFPAASSGPPEVGGGDQGEVRFFVGDGSTTLKLPGCVGVYGVRVGHTDIPEKSEIEVVDPSNHEKTILCDNLMWELSLNEANEPCLRRSMMSNDGVWQKDAQIAVRGLWEDEEE